MACEPLPGYRNEQCKNERYKLFETTDKIWINDLVHFLTDTVCGLIGPGRTGLGSWRRGRDSNPPKRKAFRNSRMIIHSTLWYGCGMVLDHVEP